MFKLGVLLFALTFAFGSNQVHADSAADCSQTKDLDRRISGCSRIIDANLLSRNLYVRNNVTAAIGARGHAYRLKGQHDLAIRDFTRVIKREDRIVPVTHLNRAISYEAIGERDKAIGDYRVVAQFQKNNPGSRFRPQAEMAREALVRLGVSLQKTKVQEPQVAEADGDDDEELRKYAPTAERVANARVEEFGIVKRQREGEQARRKAIADTESWLDAVKEVDTPSLQDVMKADVENFASSKRQREVERRVQASRLSKAEIEKSRKYLALGVEHRKRQELDKAIELYTAALQRMPDTPEFKSMRAEAYLDRGRAHFGKRQYDRAIADYTEVLKLDPNNALALSDRGAMYFNKGLNAKAIGDLTASIRIAPRDPAPYFNLGLVYGAMGRNSEAIVQYSAAIRLNPKFARAYNARAWRLYKAGKAKKGLPDAKKAIELKPKYAAAYDTRGQIYETIGDKQKAIADFRKAYQLEPNNEKRKEPLMRLGALPRDKTIKKAVSDADRMELTFWNDVKDSKDPRMLRAYLDQFPNGTFASLARIKLGKLKKAQ